MVWLRKRGRESFQGFVSVGFVEPNGKRVLEEERMEEMMAEHMVFSCFSCFSPPSFLLCCFFSL